MYSVKGIVLNLFSSPASDKYDESFKVQLLGDLHMKDGQIKKDMLTLNVPVEIYDSLSDRIGKEITLPVGFFVSNNRLTPFFPKNSKKEVKKLGEKGV